MYQSLLWGAFAASFARFDEVLENVAHGYDVFSCRCSVLVVKKVNLLLSFIPSCPGMIRIQNQRRKESFRVKKFLAWVLCICLLLMDVPGSVVAEEENVIGSGSCGTNVTWQLDSAGVLTISGNGRMYYYSSPSPAPWENHKTEIVSVDIQDGVTSIGGCAFYGCTSLTSVSIPDGVTSIDANTFRDCTSLNSITIPESITSIGGWAFRDSGITRIAFLGSGEITLYPTPQCSDSILPCVFACGCMGGRKRIFRRLSGRFH